MYGLRFRTVISNSLPPVFRTEGDTGKVISAPYW